MEFYVSVPLSRFDELIDQVAELGFHPEIRMTQADYLARLGEGDLGRMKERLDLEATSRLGGGIMVMHTGYMPQFSRGGRRHWFRNWAERMPRIVDRARELGVRIALENTWDDRPEVLLHLADSIQGGDIDFCLDTGHVNVFSRLPVGRWWDALGDRVAALHLHDNDGLSDDHLEPGKGTFDFAGLARRVRDSGRMPLLDLEMDLEGAEYGRLYIEGLLRS
jgi:sugar phosphate isomerase/epimerase